MLFIIPIKNKSSPGIKMGISECGILSIKNNLFKFKLKVRQGSGPYQSVRMGKISLLLIVKDGCNVLIKI